MLKKRFWVVPLAALIIVSLLIILGGFAIQHISWSQGYRMGQLAAGGEGVAVVPHAPYGFGHHPGLFITVGLLFLLLIVIGKFFRFCAWRMAGGPWMTSGAMARHWHRSRGPMPPWCWGWERPSEEKAEQAGPGAGSDAAEI